MLATWPDIILLVCLVAIQPSHSIRYEIQNNSTYDIIIGEEQSVGISYMERRTPQDSVINVEKQQSSDLSWILIPNFYVIPTNRSEGKIIIHFQQVSATDIGTYRVLSGDKNLTSPSSIQINLVSFTPPIDVHLLVLYIVPPVAFIICLIVIVASILVIKKRRRSENKQIEKKSPAKNYYVDREKNQKKQNQEISFAPNKEPAPKINLRTTSLQPKSSNAQDFSHQKQINFTDNRKSMDSVDSFDDCDDDYVNTDLSTQQPRFGFHNTEQTTTRTHDFTNNQRSPVALMPPGKKPKTTPMMLQYQNQPRLQKLNHNEVDDDEPGIYENF